MAESYQGAAFVARRDVSAQSAGGVHQGFRDLERTSLETRIHELAVLADRGVGLRDAELLRDDEGAHVRQRRPEEDESTQSADRPRTGGEEPSDLAGPR